MSGVTAGVVVGGVAGIVPGLPAGAAIGLVADSLGPGSEPVDAGRAPA